jgi:hypothetical protein
MVSITLDMIRRLFIAFLLVFSSCTVESPDVSGYRASFIHNGVEYEYETGPENIVTRVSGSGIMDNAINFYEGDSLHLTVVLSVDLLGLNSVDQVRALLSENDFSLNPFAPIGSTYFAPFFHHADNGGYLEIDGKEFALASVSSISDTYKGVNQQCIDVEIEFEVFANTGDPDCGNGVSCFNYFQEGKVKTRICL